MKKVALILAVVMMFAVVAYAIGEAKTAEGAVKKVDAATKTLVVDVAGKDMSFLCPTVDLAAFKAGDKVKVEYTELLGKFTATKVTAVK